LTNGIVDLMASGAFQQYTHRLGTQYD
jgi:hypothetical protein